jgi:hypothetical protein
MTILPMPTSERIGTLADSIVPAMVVRRKAAAPIFDSSGKARIAANNENPRVDANNMNSISTSGTVSDKPRMKPR